MIDPRLIEYMLNEAVEDSMGIYPASCEGVKRTEWQDGWNAYGMQFLDKKIAVVKWFTELDADKRVKFSEMLAKGDVSIQHGNNQTAFFFDTSDLFAWGYSDCEEITDDLLQPLYEACKAKGVIGMRAWWCKHENQKPQWTVEKSWRLKGVWDAELEALPECGYDEKCGRWKNKSKAEAIAELKTKEEAKK